MSHNQYLNRQVCELKHSTDLLTTSGWSLQLKSIISGKNNTNK